MSRNVFRIPVAVFSTLLAADTASAAKFKLTFSGNIVSQFDLASGSYEALTVPSAIRLTTVLRTSEYRITDYGPTTQLYFAQGSTFISDPLRAYVGSDPIGNGLGTVSQGASAYSNTSDYPTSFSTIFALYDYVTHYTLPLYEWNVYNEVGFQDSQNPRAGNGTSDYALTPALLVPYLRFKVGKPIANYFSSWSVITQNANGSYTYSAGKIWQSYDMTLESFQQIPEPSSLALIVVALGLHGASTHSRRGRQK